MGFAVYRFESDFEQYQELTNEEKKYLKDRGFELINLFSKRYESFYEGDKKIKEIPENEPCPYISLRKGYNPFIGLDQITYHRGKEGSISGVTNSSALKHPGFLLVNMVERLIVSKMDEDTSVRMGEGSFTTTPGQPIKIFVKDPDFLPIAQELVNKFKHI